MKCKACNKELPKNSRSNKEYCNFDCWYSVRSKENKEKNKCYLFCEYCGVCFVRQRYTRICSKLCNDRLFRKNNPGYGSKKRYEATKKWRQENRELYNLREQRRRLRKKIRELENEV